MAKQPPLKKIINPRVSTTTAAHRPIKDNTRRYALLAVMAVAAITYLNTLSNGFVLDDHVALASNYLVRGGVSSIGKLLTTPYHYAWNSVDTDNLYRPLSLVLFAVIYSLFGVSPMAYHFVNVALFSGCVAVLFLFLDKLFDGGRTFAAFIACILFALHPIHTEVVANVKSCDELLCFLFVFVGLLLFMRYSRSGSISALAGGSVCYMFSLLAKETTLSFAMIIPLLFYFYKNGQRKRTLYITVCTTITVLIYLGIRIAVLSHFHMVDRLTVAENMLKADISPATRFATIVYIMGYYLKLLLVPYPMSCDYSIACIPYQHLLNPLVLLSLAAYLALFGAGLYRAIKFRKDPYAFCIFFYLFTMVIFSNLFFVLGTVMADRFLFFGTVGFCFAAALLLEKLVNTQHNFFIMLRSKRLWVVLGPICAIYFILTVIRNGDWYDNMTLYTIDLRHMPNNVRLNYYLGDEILEDDTTGTAAQREQVIYTALPYMRRAIAICPQYALADYNIGVAYFNIRRYDSAEVYFLRTLQLDPHEYNAVKYVANAYLMDGQYRKAADYNELLMVFIPGERVAYLNAGSSFLQTKQYDSTIFYMKKGITELPDDIVLYANIAYTYKLMNNADSARCYDSIVHQMNSRH